MTAIQINIENKSLTFFEVILRLPRKKKKKTEKIVLWHSFFFLYIAIYNNTGFLKLLHSAKVKVCEGGGVPCINVQYK